MSQDDDFEGVNEDDEDGCEDEELVYEFEEEEDEEEHHVFSKKVGSEVTRPYLDRQLSYGKSLIWAQTP